MRRSYREFTMKFDFLSQEFHDFRLDNDPIQEKFPEAIYNLFQQAEVDIGFLVNKWSSGFVTMIDLPAKTVIEFRPGSMFALYRLRMNTK